ncbi:MAG: T9SS type A sorting domain-containing protein [Candidatus Delongbacteria bacterium]|nr:T9SS type A sorting domain-containing protein [Candidatus Delongbacteria bacterium]
MGRNELPQAAPYYSFRNIHIENVDASDNFLTPQEQWGSNQALLFVDVRAAYFGIPPTIEFENVTATGCDGMRHLFNFYEGVTLRVRNCVFWNNTYQQLLEWDDPITQTWEYNILQEPVPGIGNQVGVDPLFDEELGIPWLSPISPAIDAGNPALVYNDIEDLDNPGFALWPSQGTTRNDIGYTGGPHAGTLEHLVAVRAPRPEPLAQPGAFVLRPAFPNPFNPVTTLGYVLNRPLQVELSVYNLLGQKVRTLVSEMESAGEHHVRFDASELASGVYIVELTAGGESRTQKILLLK